MFNIKFILGYYAFARKTFTTKRPWAHFSKKGPGRKHQQGQPRTKEERNA